jgi:hypothetical protein
VKIRVEPTLKSLETASGGGRVRNAPREPIMSAIHRPALRLWMFTLAGVLAFLAVDTAVRVRNIGALSARYGEMVDAPRVDRASPTGYALGRRSMLYPNGTLDTLHWVMQVQQMFATDTWRIRHVGYDNAPAGRAVHWAAPLHWWLALVAWGDHGLTGAPMGIAVERAALVADPLLLGLVLLALVPLTAHRFGSFAGAFLALATVAAFPFHLFFMTAYFAHHGVEETCALLTVLFLLAGGGGCVRPDGPEGAGGDAGERAWREWLPDRRTARRWFAASAVAGGVGLWISAASAVPVLIGVGLGVIASAAVNRRAGAAAGWAVEPGLWRWWGAVGAATSFAAYLIEYFPAHMTLRLEVNHPLYALAWLSGGALLARLTRALAGGGRGTGGAAAWLLEAAGVAVLPAVMLLTKGRAFVVSDPFLWRLHVQAITEFEGVTRFLAGKSASLGLVSNFLPALLLLPAAVLAGRGAVPRPWKAQLALALGPVLLYFALTADQVRWWGIAYGLLFALLMLTFALLEREPGLRRRAAVWQAACVLVLLPGAVNAVQSLGRSAGVTRGEMETLAERDFAQWLRLRSGAERAVVLSSPATTTNLIYYGGLEGLGTLYWENLDGLEHAAAIFAAPSGGAAHALIRRYGVTDIVLFSWNLFAEDYAQLYLDVPPGKPLPPDVFAERLLHGGGLPPWLRLIPYRLPDNPAFAGQSILLFEVVPDQTPVEAAVHLTDYLVEMGRMKLAARQAQVLAEFPHSVPALAMLAYFQGKAGEAEAFRGTLDRIAAEPVRGGALAPGDAVRLAFDLAAGGRADAARDVLRPCLARLDERALRHLTTGSLRDLLFLSERLRVPIIDPALRRLAIELLPPYLRR